MQKLSWLEAAFRLQLADAGLPAPEWEYRFDEARRWRFDLCWPARRLAVELQGGTFARGRHVRGGGYAADCEKANAAALAGWLVLRFDAGMVESGKALATVKQALEYVGGEHGPHQ